jgi:fibronectin-binding autotransporter adhesin
VALGALTANQIGFVSAPALSNGIYAFGSLLNPGDDYQFIGLGTTVNGITPITPATTNLINTFSGATATSNVRLTSSEALSSPLTVNAVMLANGSVVVSGANLTISSGLLAARGTGNQVTVSTLTLGADATLLVPSGELEISSSIAGAANSLAKAGLGRLILAGANTYTGPTNISAGTLTVRNNTALGAVTSGTAVQNFATLELDNNVTVPEPITSAVGTGLGFIGAIRGGAGVNTLSGNFAHPNAVVSYSVVSGGILALTGTLSGAGTGTRFDKYGLGTLEISGTTANTLTTSGNSAFVFDGTLRLAKTSGGALPNGIIVGDGVGSDQLILDIGSQQLTNPASSFLIVNHSGAVTMLGGVNQTITNMTMVVGPTSSATMNTGTGTLTNLGALSVNAITGGTPQAATIAGTIALLNTPTPATRNFNINDTAALTDIDITAAIVDGATAAASIIKGGAGQLRLAPTAINPSTFTGTLTVSAGDLVAATASALGATTGGTVVSTNAALILDHVTIGAEALTLNGAGLFSSGALRGLGTSSLAGAITLASVSNIGVDAGGNLTLSGVISGANALTKILPGTLILAGTSANTYTGTTTVNEGDLVLAKSSGVAIAGQLVIGNNGGGANADRVILNANNQISSSATVTLFSSGQLDLNGFNQTLNSVTLTAGPIFSATIDTGSGTLTLGGDVTVNANVGTYTLVSPSAMINGNLNLGTAPRTFTVNQALHPAELRINANLTGTGSAALIKAGAGDLVLAGINSLPGATQLSAGTLALTADTALSTAGLSVTGASFLRPEGGPLTLTRPIQIGNTFNLTLIGDQNLTLAGSVTLAGATGTMTDSMNAAATTTISGTVQAGTVAGTLTVNTTVLGVATTISGTVVNGSGALSLTKGGNGSLVLSNANTYTGTTSVNAGILRITNNTALGSGATTVNPNATLELASGLNVNRPLTLANNGIGFVRPIGGLYLPSGSSTWSGTIGVSNPSTIAAATGATLTLSNELSGVGTLIKHGEGTLELAGSSPNTITGAIIHREGTLVLNKSAGVNAFAGQLIIGDGGGSANADQVVLQNSNQIPTQTITVASSGVLTFPAGVSDAIGALTLQFGPTDAANISLGSGADLILGGNVTVAPAANLFTDGTAVPALISGGTLSLGGATRTFDVFTTLIPSIGSSENLIVSSVISGPAVGIIKNQTGTMVLTAANTFTGPTTVNGGAFTQAATVQAGGRLILRDAGTVGGAVTVNSFGELVLDNMASNANRIPDTATLTLAGGRLTFLGNALGSTEQVGTIAFNAGNGAESQVLSQITGGGTNTFLGTSIIRSGGGTVRFLNPNNDLGTASNQFRVTGSVAGVINGTLPYAILQNATDYDFVRHDPTNGIMAAPFVTDLNTATATENVKLSTSTTLTANRTVNALMLTTGGITVDGPFNLGLSAGALINVTGNNTISTPIGFGAVEPLLYVDGNAPLNATTRSSLTLTGNLTGTVAVRKLGAGILTLSGNNSGLTNTMTVNAGVLRANGGNSLGTATTALTVNQFAALELTGGVTSARPITTFGTGLDNDGTGTIRNLSGTTTLTGAISLNFNPTPIAVVDGVLIMTGSVGSGGNGLRKLGAGVLEFAGNSSNTYTGTTFVDEGTLRLNKTAGFNAIAGPLVIGDFFGIDDVELLQSDQILDSIAMTINDGALLDLNNQNETIGGLVTLVGGSITTGTGTFTLNNNLTYNAAGTSVISGQLNLGGTARTFTVNNGLFDDDLVIDATISHTGSGGIIKAGAGTLRLNADNTASSAGTTTLSAGILALGHNNALGSGTLNVTGATTLWAAGGPRTIANAITLSNNLTLGGRDEFGGTNSLTLSGATTITGADRTLTVEDLRTPVFITGVIGQDIPGRSLNKAGLGRLTLSGANTYTGSTTITQGIITPTNNAAFGTTGPLSIAGNAVLELSGGLTLSVPVIINALNVNGFTGALGYQGDYSGAIRNLSGNNTLTSLDLRSNDTGARPFYLGIDSGSLTVNGAIVGTTNTATALPANSLLKYGPGELIYSGTTANTITGATVIAEGTLRLNKTAGTTAVGGPLVIGSNTTTAAVVVQANEQIADAAAITINAGGTLSLLSGVTEVASLNTLSVGPSSSANISLATGSTLTMNGNLTVTPIAGSNPTSPSAVISGPGSLSLGPTDRIFTVNIGPNETQLTIATPLIGTAGFTKNGFGRMLLSAANSYSGSTTVSQGALRILDATGLGGTTNGTTVAAGSALELAGGITVANEALTLSGTGILNTTPNALATAVLGSGALRSLSGSNAWTGTITLGDTIDVFGVESGSSLQVHILTGTGGSRGVAKVGTGTLEFAGTTSNTYTLSANFATAVIEGTLILNKSGSANAIPLGNFWVGDGRGGASADQAIFAATAGTDQIANTATVSVASSGLLNLNGISDTFNTLIAGSGTTGAVVQTGTGTVTFNATNALIGVVETVNPATSIITGNLNLGGATRNFIIHSGTQFDTPDIITTDVQAAIGVTGAFGINKAGRGVLRLSGTNTYTGATSINADSGTLLIDGTTATGAFTVNQGSILGGTGTIGGPVTVAGLPGNNLLTGGTINPGGINGGTGRLTVNNNVTFNAGSIFSVDINGDNEAAPVNGYDQLRVNGNVVLTLSGLGVRLTTLTDPLFDPTTSAPLKIIDKVSAGPVSNTFAGLPELATFVEGPATYQITYIGDTGNDVVLFPSSSTNPVLQGTGGGDIFVVTRNGLGDILVTLNSVLIFQQPETSLTSLTLLGLGGNDSFTVDHTAAGGVVSVPVFTDGGADSDTALIIGGIFTQLDYEFISSSPGSGRVTLTGTPTAVLGFTSIDNPVTVTSTVTTAVIHVDDDLVDYFAGPITTTVTSPGINQTQVSFSVPVPTLIFASPTTDLQLIGDDETDNFIIAGALSPTTMELFIDGQGGSDTVNFNASGLTVAKLDIIAETIGQSQGITVTGTTGLTAGTGTISLTNAANDFQGNVTVISSANATLVDANDLPVDSITASTSVTLTSIAGAIIDGNGIGVVNVTASNLTATAATGIDLDTDITTLTATSTNSPITIREANGLTVNTVNAGTGTVTLTLTAGAITDGNGPLTTNVTAGTLNATAPGGIDLDTAIDTLTALTTNNNVTIRETNGLAVDTVTAGAGNVTITLANGSITDPNASTINITANQANLTAETGIDLDTDIVTLSVDVTGTGNIAIDNKVDLTISSATAANGNIGINTQGNLTVPGTVSATGGAVALSFGQDHAGRNATISGPVSATGTATLSGGTGDDTATINVTSATLLTVDLGQGSDDYIVNFGSLGTGPVAIADTGTTGTDKAFLNGTSGNDTFEVNTTAANTVAVGTQTVTYTVTLEQMILDGGTGADTYNVQFNNGPLPGVFLIDDTGSDAVIDTANLFGTSGADSFNVNGVTSTVTFAGSGEVVSYTPAASLLPSPGLDLLAVHGPASPGDPAPTTPTLSDAGDSFTVVPSATTTMQIHGGNPTSGTGDTLTLNLVGVLSPVITPLPALPHGSMTSANKAPVSWTSIETLPVPLGLGGSFDFQTATNPLLHTQPGFLPVTNTDTFAAGAYAGAAGWVNPVSGFNRLITFGAAGDPNSPQLAALLRDGAWGWYNPGAPNPNHSNNGRFRVSVAPGQDVMISVYAGDTYSGRDFLNVYVMDSTNTLITRLNPNSNTFTTWYKPYQFVSYSGIVNPGSGSFIDIVFEDVIGGDQFWTVNGVDVRPVGLVAPLTIARSDAQPLTTPVTADGTTVDGYTGSGAAPFATLTISPEFGTPSGTDADPSLAGFQVIADGFGNFSFSIQRPTNTTNSLITVTDARGWSGVGVVGPTVASVTPQPINTQFQQAYQFQQAPVTKLVRYDFGTATSPVQTGFVGVPGTTVYGGSNGYGWGAAVGQYSRGAGSSGLSSADNLFQDGAWGFGSATFFAEVSPGDSREVRVYIGDPYAVRHGLYVQAEGGSKVSFDNTLFRYGFVTVSGTDTNNDGKLGVTIGSNHIWVVAGIELATAGNLPAPQYPTLPGVASARYDFNGAGGDTASGFTGVASTTVFDPALSTAFGWRGAAKNFERDPASPALGSFTSQQKSLYRDGSWNTVPGTFVVAVAPRSQAAVRLYIGDVTGTPPNITVSVEGAAPVAITSPSYASYVVTGASDENGDGVVTITISSTSHTWVLNGVDFEATPFGGPAPVLPPAI